MSAPPPRSGAATGSRGLSGAAVPVDGAAELVVAPEPAGSLPQATKKVATREAKSA